MLSNKIIEHLKQQGIYSEKEDEKYKTALINLGIDLVPLVKNKFIN